ncbi:7TM diverse intracellular signaling domain-containing protein [Janthinobacterium agaricidamnosum]|uniref:Virulence sensor protein BvgS n=1 Tax=Janthinobacterium agaricidamnosum NBRC 102515 = DSM 9628 TaxID=1349767 RepID=W0V589_9BURK|nr:7TM diverse intracellular signaling domain-containing protein [Janthinobacterium agaricidamnosum]CDG82508.1 his Kinase A domain protein [Janthinobacterium agaricidamnosum NBRC 102515 = DSM 9628]
MPLLPTASRIARRPSWRRLCRIVGSMLPGLMLGLMLLWAVPAPASAAALVLQDGASQKIGNRGQLFQAGDDLPPADAAALPAWLATLQPVPKVNLFGGSYWLYAELRNDSDQPAWVFDPNDTLIDRIDTRIYDNSGAAPLRLLSGYRQPHEYLLHYGKDVTLVPGTTYRVLVHFSSPYFARAPVFSVVPRDVYRRLVARENFLTVASIGALLALGLFNFFIFSITRDKSSFYYALYVMTYGMAWAITFHVFTDLFDWHQLELHYVPFFLLPVLSTLFYNNFLRLGEFSPLLEKISRVNLVLPLLVLPSCFFYLSYAHTLATIVISIWMTLALASGIVVWRKGYQPARFFVLAFIALMLPGLFILPSNVGLAPALVDNAQLLTLLGGTLDGLLLAFALADQIRVLRNHLEQRVRERTVELTHTNDKLTLAKEHAEVVSRHRIDFLSAMSHDIRTPLAGVIGMLKFALRDQSVRGRTEEYLRIGLHNSESLLAILNDILDFSKIDAGKLALETLDFDLLALIGDATGIVQSQADAKSLLLRSDLALDLPRYVRADPTRLRQILINLLGNGIKFTASGEVLLEVKMGKPARNGRAGIVNIEFIISDTGPGIAPEILPRLFQKFEQADHSTTRRYGGTGLGLAICKELVELMGGSIGVDSRLGVGSRFRFSLPLHIGAAPPPDPRLAPRRERHAYRLRALCAEDVRTNQIIIGTLLEGMGHDVKIVENGLEALQALSASDFDVVLMDGRMPLMDGEQTTRLIRIGGSPEYPVPDPAIPVIALTANASEHDRQRYLAAGMDSFLSKPVDERLLYDQIDHVIMMLLSRGRLLSPTMPPPRAKKTAREEELALQFGISNEFDGLDGKAGQHGRHDGECDDHAIRIVPLVGLSHQHMQRITQAFLDEAPRRLQLARDALQANNANAVAAAFHALKGSASYLSRPALHNLCKRMENLATNGDLDQVALGFPEVDAALKEACDDLQA